MPDDARGASWPPRWELPPDLPAPAKGPSEVEPESGRPTAAARVPPPTTYALPPDLVQPPEPVEAVPAPPPPRPPTAGNGRRDGRRPVLITAAAAVVVLAIAVLVLTRPWAGGDAGTDQARDSTGAGPAATAGAPGDEGPTTVQASADCVSPPSKDAGGNPTSYDPANALDDRPDTAWRCDGDGVGHQVRVDFGRPLTVTEVGIIPGLAKTDPYDGSDRYRQCRRIAEVRLTFDDGDSVTANLDTSPDNRAVQHVTLTPVTSRSVTVTVLSSVEGSPVGPLPATDKVAISTLTWSAT
jgi:hypothetical protein